jgi:hypothetical protein
MRDNILLLVPPAIPSQTGGVIAGRARGMPMEARSDRQGKLKRKIEKCALLSLEDEG